MTIGPSDPRHAGVEYQFLSQLKNAISGESRELNLMRAVQILRGISRSYNWVGIYLVKDENLVLAAYAGDAETEHVQIPIGQGICGLAAKQAETIIVPNVSKDPRYLMCFSSTRSEIVVPIRAANRVLGEIDIDSDRLAAFSDNDKNILEGAAVILANYLENSSP